MATDPVRDGLLQFVYSLVWEDLEQALEQRLRESANIERIYPLDITEAKFLTAFPPRIDVRGTAMVRHEVGDDAVVEFNLVLTIRTDGHEIRLLSVAAQQTEHTTVP